VRLVVPTGADPASGSPRRIPNAGSASRTTSATDPPIASARCSVTARTHRSPAGAFSGLSERRRRSLGAPMCVPATAMIAGSALNAIRTAMRTVPAAASPITVRKGMLTTARPVNAMITVSPANATAEPAVAFARAAASGRSNPSARFSR
jgi:hypothetical protein